MVAKDFKESSIPQTYSTSIYGEKQYNVAQEHVWKVVDIMVNGITEVLRDIKSTEHPVAFVIKKADDFLAAAYVKFFPNEEDPSQPGNWTYTWTFYEDDLPTDNIRVVSPYDAEFCSYFRTYGADKHNMSFKTPEFQGNCISYMMEMVRKWLDENAVEDDTVVLSLKDVVDFEVKVENGEKIFTCEVDGEIKQRIKSDKDIEV